jgi:SulP family sulfate permease
MTQPIQKTSHNKRFVSQMIHELQPRQLLPNLIAGLIIGVIVIIFSISLVSLVFAGNLSSFVPNGIALTLFGAMIIGIAVTLFSSFSGTIATPQEAPAAILALIAVSISYSMPAASTPEEAFITVVAVIALTSILTGILFLVLGYFKLGELIRFLPYPVIGGFLAGTGWLLIIGAIAVTTDVLPNLATLPVLFQGDMLLHWLPALIFAFLLLIILSRYNHYLIMPTMILGFLLLFYVVTWITNTSMAELSAHGWLLEPPEQGLSQSFASFDLAQVNWHVILGQAGNVATILVISVVALLLNASSIELVVGDDIDLNHDLQAAGIGNVICGFFGGLVGFHALTPSTLNYKIGNSSRLVGLITAVLCGLVLFWGMPVLYFFPKLLLGSLLMVLGLAFLVEWVYQAWFKFSRIDYLIIITILIVIAVAGFLQGVIVGLALALVLFVVNYSQVRVVKHTLTGVTYQSQVIRCRTHRQILEAKGNEIYILQLQGFIFFGTANKLLNQVRQRIDATDLPRLRFAALDFRQVTGIDSTATLSFSKMEQIAKAHQIVLVFTTPSIENHLPGQGNCVYELCERIDSIKEDEIEKIIRIFPDLDHGLEWCENQILVTAGENIGEYQETLRAHLISILPDVTNLDSLLSYFERLDVDLGFHLMKQGAPPEFLYFIESGQVTAQLEFPDRNPVRLETMRGGNVVGEIGFYLNQPRTATVIADEPSTIYRLSMQALKQMEQDDHETAVIFHRGMIRLVSERLTRSVNTVNALQR